jgi:NTP pyrophosphatase (non-canonical NTP hydrolase)
MNLNEYQELALRTAGDRGKDQLSYLALGLSGESGEFADAIKKIVYHGHPMDRESLKHELGDVLWYLALLADELGMTLNDVAASNIEKLKNRYPDGYSDHRSLNRREK